MGAQPVVPDYRGACVSNVVPALLGPPDRQPSWLPAATRGASQVVLLVLDGLGWEQLAERSALAPVLTGMDGGPVLTVVPSTTATALTSIATGASPGEHGVIGYRMYVGGSILNVLRWTTPEGDARSRIPPSEVQPLVPFCGQTVPAVARAEFIGSGFSAAHLHGVTWRCWRVTSTLLVEVGEALRGGAPFVYAYYDGMDKVAHEYGLGTHFDAELAFVDRMVADLLALLPDDAVLVVTSDHGQVDVGPRVKPLDPALLRMVALQSGEGRFRWLHAKPGKAEALLAATRDAYGHESWVAGRDEVEAQGWFGPHLTAPARGRLGDVALVARDDIAYDDPADTGPFKLIGRHGSLTPAEMIVPLLAGRRR